jgi:hypothetical protein
MCSGGGTRALPRVGSPIRRSPDQSLVSSSPGLIAAAHVLHRLQVPRHPPCALIHLMSRREHHGPLWSFQGARGHCPPAEKTRRPPGGPGGLGWRGLSKLNSSKAPAGCAGRGTAGVDVVPGRAPTVDDTGSPSTGASPSRPRRAGGGSTRSLEGGSGLVTGRPSTRGTPAVVGATAFPRKEVIQPQLPLRLPCYDFTPITDSAFGRCLPCGLAHGLRAFPAFVV